MGKARKEEAEKRAKEAEEKKKRLEEAERKRQEMMAAQKEKGGKKQQAPALDARREMSQTKEQVEEEMKISLSIRIKPLNLDAMDSDELRNKAANLWDTIVTLETDKYYEQRRLAQDYELKELKERQKIQLRNKAIKKGLDPEAFTGKHPPKIRMFSKYERRTDTRTYGDRKKLYEGGWEVVRAEMLEAMWKDKYDDWTKRPRQACPSGSVSALARRLETQRLLRVRRKKWEAETAVPRKKSMKKRRRRKKRRKKKRNKKFLAQRDVIALMKIFQLDIVFLP